MRLRFSTEARDDLDHIGDFIADASPSGALSFMRELRAKSKQISEMPFAYPVVPGFEHLGIRRRVVGNYLIFYRIDGDVLTIVHIVHGARDYDSLLDQL